MTAKEMFEQIGWMDVSERYPSHVCVYQHQHALITFFENGIFGCFGGVVAELEGECYPLDMKELTAVYQQCKELGWLE